MKSKEGGVDLYTLHIHTAPSCVLKLLSSNCHQNFFFPQLSKQIAKLEGTSDGHRWFSWKEQDEVTV